MTTELKVLSENQIQVQSRFSATHICAQLFISVKKYVTAILVQLAFHLGRHTTMDKCRKERTRLSLEEKFKALKMIRKGRPDIEIMSTYNVSGRFVRKLKREGHKLPHMEIILDKAKRRKSISTGRYPHIENHMLGSCTLFISLSRKFFNANLWTSTT